MIENIAQSDIQRTIDGDTHRPFFIVLTDVSHTVIEVRIVQAGHGDQQLVLQLNRIGKAHRRGASRPFILPLGVWCWRMVFGRKFNHGVMINPRCLLRNHWY